MGDLDYVMTLDSDTEDVLPPPPATSAVASSSKSKSKAKPTPADADKELDLDGDFTFDLSNDPYADLISQAAQEDFMSMGGLMGKKSNKPTPISVEEIIARRKLKRKRDGEDSESEEEEEEEDEEEVGEDEDEEDPIATSDEEEDDEENEDEVEFEVEEDEASGSDDDSDIEDAETTARKAAYFSPSSSSTSKAHSSFLTMNLSRPILKSLTALNLSKPTPIQCATIPIALLGKDIVGNAVTGSGKTLAFLIPILERLLYREKGERNAATRCLILVPTRELGVQCYEVACKMAATTDVRTALLVGGLSLKGQEATLRTRPDIVIATPGRLIDHIHNSPSFTLDALDILVLDEADRMLEDGFADELKEIIKACPVSRQTMLFSATMTDSIDDLIKMSLNKPMRLFVDPNKTTSKTLIQEFVRVRKEEERTTALLALCTRTFKTKSIIFVRSKKLAHQLHIVFQLFDLSAAELHGDLSQEQRLTALQSFRDGKVDFLIATDLASRGLDIKGVETVINYDMPGQLALYLHRVGRTARAGRNGRSVTLVGEADRKMLKAAVKHSSSSSTDQSIRQRTLPAPLLVTLQTKLSGLKDEITAILGEEKEEKAIRVAEMELKKGENMIEHEEEIFGRPKRVWFQSQNEKEKAKEVSKQVHENGGKAASKGKKGAVDDAKKPARTPLSGLSRRAKRRKLIAEEDEKYNDSAAIGAAIRSAKKAHRPVKIGLPEPKPSKSKKGKKKDKKGTVFGSDMGARGGGGGGASKKGGEGFRAKKGDSVKLNKKSGGKGKAGGKGGKGKR